MKSKEVWTQATMVRNNFALIAQFFDWSAITKHPQS